MRQAITFTPVESKFEKDDQRSNENLSMFWKEALLEGVWKHPIRGFTVKVDKDRLHSLADNFLKQKERDIKVPIPSGHKYSVDVNNGFVEEMEVRKKPNGKHSLFVLMNVEKAETLSGINKTIKDVSVSLNPDLLHSTSDGQVEKLGNCVEHVALTNYPVIAGMGDFVAFDKEGETVTISQLDLVNEEIDETVADAFELDPEQLQEFARDVAQQVLAAYSVKQDTGKTQTQEGEENMPLSTEKLRAIEKKFGLDENSLTEENWFETIEGLDLAKGNEVPKEFDISASPEFAALQERNGVLMLDLNQRRLGDISHRLKDAQDSGRINKAAFDKIVAEPAQLQFSSETCTGDEWEAWATKVEAQLSVVEELPEGGMVSVQKRTASHTSTLFDQTVEFDSDEGDESDEEAEALDKAADEAIKSVTPEYHMDNVKLNPKSGTFESIAG